MGSGNATAADTSAQSLSLRPSGFVAVIEEGPAETPST
jgi:hypothetical protein